MEDSFCLNAFYVQYWASRQSSNKSMQNNACAYRTFFLFWLKVVLLFITKRFKHRFAAPLVKSFFLILLGT